MKNFERFPKVLIIIGIILILIGLLLLGISFYKIHSSSFQLQITETMWNETGTYEDNVRTFQGTQDDMIDLEGFYGKITFKIIDVKKDSITLETNQAMSLRSGENGRIDLTTQDTKFIVQKNHFIILDTPTTDSGFSYKIEFKG